MERVLKLLGVGSMFNEKRTNLEMYIGKMIPKHIATIISVPICSSKVQSSTFVKNIGYQPCTFHIPNIHTEGSPHYLN